MLQALIITVLQLSHSICAPSPHHSPPSPSSPEPRLGTLCKRIFSFRTLQALIITVLQLSHQLSHILLFRQLLYLLVHFHHPLLQGLGLGTMQEGMICYRTFQTHIKVWYLGMNNQHIFNVKELLHLFIHPPHPILPGQ
jgi:hypothetical protein